MVLSLVQDMLGGAPCSIDVLIEAEANRKSTHLSKDRYVVVNDVISCIRHV